MQYWASGRPDLAGDSEARELGVGSLGPPIAIPIPCIPVLSPLSLIFHTLEIRTCVLPRVLQQDQQDLSVLHS